MANRFPLIVDSVNLNIKELPSGDNLDLTGSDALFGDNDKAIFGAGSDLQIYHDGSNSIITESGAGSLILRGTNTYIQDSSSVNMIQALSGGAVTLNYNSAPKLATTSTGIDVTGVITTDGMTTSADINVADNVSIRFGDATNGDLVIKHDGTNSSIVDRGDGDLLIQGSTNVKLQNFTGSKDYFVGSNGGASTVYYDGSAKLATTSTGIDVTGTVTADGLTVDGDSTVDAITYTANSSFPTTGVSLNSNGFSYEMAGTQGKIFRSASNTKALMQITNDGDISFYEDTGTTAKLTWDASDEALEFADNAKATFGAGSDLKIFHDGSNSYIQENGTGDLLVGATNFQLKSGDYGESMLTATDDGAVTLFYNNASKLATTNTGIDVTGTVTIPDYIIHDGNTGTKFGFGAANTINFIANGSDKLTLANSYVVFNEPGTDTDFRVESDGFSHALFVDAGNNQVIIGSGTAIGSALFAQRFSSNNTYTTTNDTRYASGKQVIYNESNTTDTFAGITMLTGSSSGGTIELNAVRTGTALQSNFVIKTRNSDGNSSEKLRLTGHGGNLLFNQDTVIGANTSDNSDNQALYLCGGGNQTVGRGANIRVHGNEDSPAGDVLVYSGNVANSEIQLRAYTSTSAIRQFVNEADRLSLHNDRSIFNDDSGNIDFRVESDSDTHALFIDGGTGNVLMGTSSVAYAGTVLNIGTTSDSQNGVQITTSTTGNGYILFGDGSGADAYRGQIHYTHSDDGMAFTTGGFVRAKFSSSEIAFNDVSADTNFRVESNGNTHAIFVDAGNNTVNIARSSGPAALNVQADSGADGIAVYGRSSDNISQITNYNSTGTGLSQLQTRTQYTELKTLTDVPLYFSPNNATKLKISTSETIVNDNSQDHDFRVESNNNANMLFVDAGNDHVSIGTATDLGYMLNVNGSIGSKDNLNITSAGGANYTQGTLQISSSTIDTPTARGQGVLYFNEGHDVTWYTGTGYNQGGDFHIGYATGASLNTAAARVDGADNSNMMFTIYRSSGAVFNELGNDRDFRVESNNQTHKLFVEASSDRIGVNQSSPSKDVHIKLKNNLEESALLVESSGSANYGGYIRSAFDTQMARFGALAQADGGLDGASVAFEDFGRDIAFRVNEGGNNAERMRLDKTGGLVLTPLDSTATIFNEGSADSDFRVESNNNANMLFVDGANDTVGIGTNSTIAQVTTSTNTGKMSYYTQRVMGSRTNSVAVDGSSNAKRVTILLTNVSLHGQKVDIHTTGHYYNNGANTYYRHTKYYLMSENSNVRINDRTDVFLGGSQTGVIGTPSISLSSSNTWTITIDVDAGYTIDCTVYVEGPGADQITSITFPDQ